MDIQEFREPTGEPQGCPVCGEKEHVECDENLLNAMWLSAHTTAKAMLSEEAMETLKMLESASETLDLKEVWEMSGSLDELHDENDLWGIHVYFARITLLREARK